MFFCVYAVCMCVRSLYCLHRRSRPRGGGEEGVGLACGVHAGAERRMCRGHLVCSVDVYMCVPFIRMSCWMDNTYVS